MRFLLPMLAMTLLFAAPARAETAIAEWSIVKDSSTLRFDAVQMGAPFEGSFKTFGGKIAFDPANLPASKVDMSIDMSSVEASSSDRNNYLPMPDWFNTDAFPEAHFVTTAITKGLDKNQYVAKGDLTIRNVTLPISMPFTLDITKSDSGVEIAKMNGEAVLNRLDYGVGQGEWKDTKSVENQVKIKVSLTAQKK